MKTLVIASTKPNQNLSLDEAIRFAGQIGGICYTKTGWTSIKNEDVQKTLKRCSNTLKSGHHSLYDQVWYNFYFEGLPKILAMVLNNEKFYVTSEKSARYTQMQPNPQEKIKYDKWLDIFQEQIKKTYPQIKKRKRKKLAQENARYLTSVFTPTKMVHTISLRQVNYIMHWFNNFINNQPNTNFNKLLKPVMQNFNKDLEKLYLEELDPKMKIRNISLFASRSNYQEFFNEVYSTNYKISLAGLAQEHRHRTINYQMQPINNIDEFFIPPILLTDNILPREWLNDMKEISENYPQGFLVDVHERGCYEDFISKTCERLCGHAQLEIMLQTKKTLDQYLLETKEKNLAVYNELLPYSQGPKCTFVKCKEPCLFGKGSLERII